MDWDRDMLEIHQTHMRRIQMAVAIGVIRSKPPDQTSKEYAKSLRKQYLRQRKKTINETDVFESQKESLFTQLLSVLPEPKPRERYSLNSFTNDDEALLEDFEDSDTSENNPNNVSSEDTAKNIEFITALSEIRTLTNSNSSIPTQKYRSVLSRCSSSLQTLNDSPDSGFGSSQSSCILSGNVNEVMRSQNVDVFLSKSVDIVWKWLLSFIKVSATGVATWCDDSLLDASVKAIVGLVDSECKRQEDCEVRKISGEYVQKVVMLILENVERNTTPLQLLRCKVVTELSRSRFLCKDSINIIVDIVNVFKENVKHHQLTMVNERRNILLPNDRESVFFLFRVLNDLLCRYDYKRNEMERRKKALNDSKNVVKVTDLWKRLEREPIIVEEAQESYWIDVLEQTVTVLTDNFPQIMRSVYRCLMLLKID